MNLLLKKIIFNGLDEFTPLREERSIELINIFSALILGGNVLSIPGFALSGLYTLLPFSAGALVLFSLPLLFNARRRYKASKMIFALLLNFYAPLCAYMLGEKPGLEYTLIIAAFTSFTFFKRVRTRFWLMMLSMAMFVLCKVIYANFPPFFEEHPWFDQYVVYAVMAGVFLGGFLTVNGLKYEQHIYENRLEAALDKLKVSNSDLQDLNSRFNAQAAALNQGAIVAMTDIRGKIIYVNDKFCEISQYARNELLGKDHRMINSGVHAKEFFAHMWQTIAKGKIWRGQVCNMAKDGSLYWVDTVIAPVLDIKDRIQFYLALRFDITEAKKNEAYLQELNEELQLNNEEITRQGLQLKSAYQLIIDSLQYAQRIQQAILADESAALQNFKEGFVFFKPKDIVSGDFYWFGIVNRRQILILGDCTGHGVPGAFMTVLGSTSLNEIVNEKEITEPAAILRALDKKITDTLHTDTYNESLNDGMDLAVLVFDEQTRQLHFAGARMPLWYVRETKLYTMDGAKYPLGSTQYDEKVFETQTLDLQSGDTFYVFSDGYQDQFGGPARRKFMKKHFRNLLISIAGFPMNEQKEILKDTLDTWKGKEAQTDDVLVIGIKI